MRAMPMQVFVEERLVDADGSERCQDRLDLRGEQNPFALRGVEQRFDSETVAAADQLPTLRVGDQNRPHTAKPSEALGAPSLVSGENDFGIDVRAEPMTFGLELRAKLREVVDFAVEDDPMSSVGRDHWLDRFAASVLDSQPPKGQAEAWRRRMLE